MMMREPKMKIQQTQESRWNKLSLSKENNSACLTCRDLYAIHDAASSARSDINHTNNNGTWGIETVVESSTPTFDVQALDLHTIALKL